MKKIKNLSLLAMLFAVVAAFAFKPAPRFAVEYAVASEDATYYYISESLAGETLGTHFLCNNQVTKKCRISSDATPDSQKRILKTQATALDTDKVFVDLFPAPGDID